MSGNRTPGPLLLTHNLGILMGLEYLFWGDSDLNIMHPYYIFPQRKSLNLGYVCECTCIFVWVWFGISVCLFWWLNSCVPASSFLMCLILAVRSPASLAVTETSILKCLWDLLTAHHSAFDFFPFLSSGDDNSGELLCLESKYTRNETSFTVIFCSESILSVFVCLIVSVSDSVSFTHTQMHMYHVHMCDKCKSLYVLMCIEDKGQTQMSFFRNYPPWCLRMDLSQQPRASQSDKNAWSMSSRDLPVSASPELGLLAPTAIVSFIQFKSSCIPSKHNPNWAISPAFLAGVLYIMEPKFIITGFYCEKSIPNICENHFFISKANDNDISFFHKKCSLFK